MYQNDEKTARKPIKVRNKDIPLLSCVLYSMQAVRATEQKRMWQQDRLWNITQKITGLPGGSHVPSGYDANFAVIGEIEEKYAEELDEYAEDLKRAEEILNSIQSTTLRTFVTMKYVLDLPDQAIMRELNIRRRKYESMKKAVEEAENMSKVKWIERYELTKTSKNYTSY